MRNAGAMVRGWLAFFGAFAVLIVPPWALARFAGSPLPAGVPSWQEFADGLTTTGISDGTVIKVLAALCWFIWLQIAVALANELVAVLRQTRAPSLPILPGLGGLAARWVAAIVLVAGPVTVARPTLAIAEDPPVTLVVDEVPPALVAPAPTPQTELYTVQRRDSYWAIAEAKLGDGMRWREIRDLNIGRAQPGGGTVSASSDLLEPGWTLLVPRVPGGAAGSIASHVVERGDSLWSIAEDQVEAELGRPATSLEVDPRWREVIQLNPDLHDPNVLHAGQVVNVTAAPEVTVAEAPPPVEVPPPTTVPASPPSAPEPTTSTTAMRAADPEGALEAPVDQDDSWHVPVSSPILGIAATGLAAGVAAELRRRRRQRAAELPAGLQPATPPESYRELLTEIALHEDTDHISDLAAAVDQLARHVHRTAKIRGRRPRLVQIGADLIEVLLDRPALPPPEGWRPHASGAVWSVARPVEHSSEDTQPCPTLVTIGLAEDDTSILLDLESAAVVTIAGDGPTTGALVRSMITELSHPSLADLVTITVVDPDDAAGWPEVEHDTLAWARQSADVLAAHKLQHTFDARGSGRDLDGVVPLVVFAPTVDAAGFRSLCELALNGAAIAVVVLTDVEFPGATAIKLGRDGTLSIPDLNLVCTAQGITASTAVGIDEALDHADTAEAVPVVQQRLPVDLADPTEPYTDPPYDILVRVLGPIEVVGGREPLKGKPAALVAYLATHGPSTVEAVEAAIWPDGELTARKRLYNTIAIVRKALGPDHLPPHTGNTTRYVVGPGVVTDLDLFEARLEWAKHVEPEAAVEVLIGALQLISGAPFSYGNKERNAYTWVDTEHLAGRAEALVGRALDEVLSKSPDDDVIEEARSMARRAAPSIEDPVDA